MGAGGIALSAGFAEQKRFPSNGVRIVLATVVLTLLVALTNGTRVEPLAKAFAGLMLLATVFAYVPGFQRDWTAPKKAKPKGKANG
jgi:hypothetical protein